MGPAEYRELLRYGIGLTDICKVSSGADRRIGGGDFDVPRLVGLLKSYRPAWIAFNGKNAAKAALSSGVQYGKQAGEPARQSFRLDLGSQPVRLLLASDDGRWVVQLQQDRIAVHERRVKKRPSFKHVRPQLRKVATQASAALGRELLGKQRHSAELVELIYDNRITAGKGWDKAADLHKVLRVVAPPATESEVPIEQISVAFSSLLQASGEFAGRLHVQAAPEIELQTGETQIHLQLISHRYSRQRAFTTVLADCHRDIVEGFTAVTTPRMHKVWERYQ